MEKNVGGTDRNMRWAAGSLLLVGGIVTRGWMRWAAWSLGGTLLGTAATQKCACNKALGINTYSEPYQSTLDEPPLGQRGPNMPPVHSEVLMNS